MTEAEDTQSPGGRRRFLISPALPFLPRTIGTEGAAGYLHDALAAKIFMAARAAGQGRAMRVLLAMGPVHPLSRRSSSDTYQ